jgi:hypothetical protein
MPRFDCGTEEVLRLSELRLLSKTQMRQIVSGIILVIRNRLRWRDLSSAWRH